MLLELDQVGFDYASGIEIVEPLLSSVSFSLSAGKLLHLEGENGCGKTTLLKLLAGILLPHAGEIRFKSVNIHRQLAWYQTQLVYVGHRAGLSGELTVLENCRYDLKCLDNARITQLLQRFNLWSEQHQVCRLLSSGQRRRLSLLRLFLSDTLLWIIDEPLVGLDVLSVQVFWEALSDHLQRGGMVILTSHQPLGNVVGDHEEYQLC